VFVIDADTIVLDEKKKLYLKKHKEVEARTFLSNLLFEASIEGDIQKLKQALKEGGDPNHKDEDGNTPLSEACLAGYIQIVKILL
jgi:ankyrin repeat protein